MNDKMKAKCYRLDYNELGLSTLCVEKDKEIERLQDLCNKYEKEHKTTYEIWKKDIYLYNSLVDKIDKAIEYIKEKEYVDYNPTLDGSEDDSYMKLPRSLNLFNEELDILLDILERK